MPRMTLRDRTGRATVVDAVSGISVMENIRGLDGSVEAICGGLCICSTCHVYVADAWVDRLPPRSYEETVMLCDLDSFDETRSRLSCQIRTEDSLDGLEITVAPPD